MRPIANSAGPRLTKGTIPVDPVHILCICSPVIASPVSLGGAPGVVLSIAPTTRSAMENQPTDPFVMVFVASLDGGALCLPVVREVAAGYPDLPVVLVCDAPDADLVRSAIDIGAADVVQQPLSGDRLTIVVARNLARMVRRRQDESDRELRIKTQSIRALAGAVDARESATALHSRRVAALACELATDLKLGADELHRLELAAIVHDVGKIGVPDSILLKPGSLTDDEWVTMKTHAATGAEIVSQIDELEALASVVRHHHERIDGSGYPDGLRGGDIPLLSRLIAVTDAYEVMTANRAYRGAMPQAEAIHRLRVGAGRQFDAELVERFCSLHAAGRMDILHGDSAIVEPEPTLFTL